ncbi:MAG: nitrate ABC transporter ATP-binding protein [Arcobacter sp.]|nr:MAG: nitrate ABC transporter ATP-binding protein [Arcobacter sp.]
MLNINIKKKFFKEELILKDIDITLKKGEFLSIIGPSGCGKTTLLNTIASLDDDYLGALEGDFSNISFMFQDHRLIPWLSVKENLLLVSKTKDMKEIENLMKLIGLENILEEFPNKLSGGMARRVSLIRAFINRPKLILLDEPFISLDYPTSMSLQKDFLSFCREFNPTVILVTHDISEAIYLSNRILFFSKKPTSEIYKYENINRQEFNQKKIDDIKNQILEEYPKILEGIV